jgi:hypothetical protein
MTVDQMARDLIDDDNASWTRLGAYALAEYLDELSDDIGEPIEWDRVAVRCDYSEYTLSEVLEGFHTYIDNYTLKDIAIALIEGGCVPSDAIVDCLREHTGCVLHVVQGTNPLTGVTDEDTFIVQDF